MPWKWLMSSLPAAARQRALSPQSTGRNHRSADRFHATYAGSGCRSEPPRNRSPAAERDPENAPHSSPVCSLQEISGRLPWQWHTPHRHLPQGSAGPVIARAHSRCRCSRKQVSRIFIRHPLLPGQMDLRAPDPVALSVYLRSRLPAIPWFLFVFSRSSFFSQ